MKNLVELAVPLFERFAKSTSMSSPNRACTQPIGLDEETVTQAVAALQAHCVRKPRQQKVAESADDVVFVQLVFKQPPARATFKPRAVSLLHPLYTPSEDDVCFIVKDPQRLVKDHLAERNVVGITKVLGASKVKKRYGTHEGRRELLQMYDLFLVDDRVFPMMPKLLGRPFIESKKMPLPIRMDRDIPSAIQKAFCCTSFMPGSGATCSVRIAKLSFSCEQVVANIHKCLAEIARLFSSGLSAFQTIYIKTSLSPALPIFVSLPTDGDFDRDVAVSSSKRKKRSKPKTPMHNEFDSQSVKRQKKSEPTAEPSTKDLSGSLSVDDSRVNEPGERDSCEKLDGSPEVRNSTELEALMDDDVHQKAERLVRKGTASDSAHKSGKKQDEQRRERQAKRLSRSKLKTKSAAKRQLLVANN